MKNRILIALGALVVSTGLAACSSIDIPDIPGLSENPTTSESTSKEDKPEETSKDTSASSEETSATSEESSSEAEQTLPELPADLPVTEGSTTYAFELASYSVVLPEYASFYITGGTFGWATGVDAVSFTRFNETNIYYATSNLFDETANQAKDYQLLMGYNESSNMPTIGLDWSTSLKSTECGAVKYPDNPKFEAENNAPIVNLGFHSWASALPEPPKEPITEISVTVTLKDTGTTGFAEGITPKIVGDGECLGKWGTHNDMELVEEVYTFTITGVMAKAEFCITNGTWDGKVCADGKDKNIIIDNKNNTNITAEIAFDFSKLGTEVQACTVTIK